MKIDKDTPWSVVVRTALGVWIVGALSVVAKIVIVVWVLRWMGVPI